MPKQEQMPAIHNGHYQVQYSLNKACQCCGDKTQRINQWRRRFVAVIRFAGVRMCVECKKAGGTKMGEFRTLPAGV